MGGRGDSARAIGPRRPGGKVWSSFAAQHSRGLAGGGAQAGAAGRRRGRRPPAARARPRTSPGRAARCRTGCPRAGARRGGRRRSGRRRGRRRPPAVRRDRWKRRSEDLKKQLDEARRAGKRQAAPFAKERPQGSGKPGRRSGAQYGRQGSRRCPPRVDETHRAPAPTACPDCGGAVEVTRVDSQHQEELPPVRPIVRRFDIEVGRCSQCRRRVQGRHRLQTSDALGAAAVQLGPGLASLVVELHTEMGVPLAKVAGLLRPAGT